MKPKQQVRIFDTTLRDGQQCPGAGMSPDLNIEYALLASELKVDVLEAGFPSASKGDFQIVNQIATLLTEKNSTSEIAGLCQLRDEQIDITMEALNPALKNNKALLHVYVPVSPELMRASLGDKADKTKIVEKTGEYIARAYKAGFKVEFSPESYSQQGENFDFVTDLICAAIESGANIINCPDTVGSAFSLQEQEYFVNKMNLHKEIVATRFPNSEIIWSAHCHNDYGLAVQNSINAVINGPATQIEGCFNGIGERAGNVALESVIMILDQYGSLESAKADFYTNINIEKLQKISNFVSTYMLPRQPHWPVTGDNASKHSSGGHTNAVLSDPLAYQPFDPRRIGNKISLIFGPLSGGNHAQSVIHERGYKCEDSEKGEIAQYIKNLYSERRKGITDDELLLAYIAYRSPINISNYDYSRSSSRVTLGLEGKVFSLEGKIEQEQEGKDSALAVLKKIIEQFLPIEIVNHKSESDREGIEAQSVSRIIISTEDQDQFEGIGRDSDIEISALKALTDAVNKAYVFKHYKK